MPFQTFDAWDQAVLTDLIRRPPAGRAPGAAEDDPNQLGARIAPFTTLLGREAKVRVADLRPFGTAKFRAPDATPPLYSTAVNWEERVIGLALIDEMQAIGEEEWMKLQSSDENIARSAGLSLVDRGRQAVTRNQRTTEKMRWDAFAGEVDITYESGAKWQVDYTLPSGHRPTAATVWSDTTNADPVTDIQNWSEQIAADSGYYGTIAHMNSKTYNYLVQSDKIKTAINFYAPSANTIYRPRREDILNLFTSFAADVQVVIYDNGYREEGQTGIGVGSIRKYLPDGKVLMTTSYSIDGVNIADTLDGQVSVSAGYNSVSVQQGEQAEVMLDHLSKTHFLRYASARLPRILVPEAFLWATVT